MSPVPIWFERKVLHADFKNLEEKIEGALIKLRVTDAKSNRE